MKPSVFFMALVTLFLSLGGAQSASTSDWDKCNGSVPDLGSCTRIIRSGGNSGKSLAILHYNRGVAYQSKCQLSRAKADYSKAVALDPGFKLAFYNRGTVKMYMGDGAGAALRACRTQTPGYTLIRGQSAKSRLNGVKTVENQSNAALNPNRLG
jgi:hypothetical protein